MTEKQYGILATLIFHGVALLLLLLSYITLSKPSPSEGGILINFGNVESAYGPDEPAKNNAVSEAAAVPEPQTKSASAEEGVMTQDFEDAPAVKKTEPVKKTKKTVEKPVVTEKKAVDKPKAPTVNRKALYSNKSTAGQSETSTGSSSEGIYKGSGNMGDVTGTPESDNYSKGLGGNGIGFDLNGRSSIHLQKPDFNVLKEGIVVVEITVDRSGNVISATPGVKGSTLVDNTLYAAAKRAALNSKFNVKTDAQEKQIGNITYHFKLE
jgi:colicin import membrane protein